MSFKRKYLEEKYKYLILKKQYKNLIGGAAITDGLFENQRLCLVKSSTIDKARIKKQFLLRKNCFLG